MQRIFVISVSRNDVTNQCLEFIVRELGSAALFCFGNFVFVFHDILKLAFSAQNMTFTFLSSVFSWRIQKTITRALQLIRFLKKFEEFEQC